jgi:glycosyltransferase involved in cell wall biosynthesis
VTARTGDQDGHDVGDGIAVSVVLPVFNEQAAIEGVVRDVVEVTRDLAPGRSEVVVVDDGSVDATRAIVDRLAGELPEVRVIHQANAGHGPALLAGFDQARGRWIAHLDTDDQIPAKELIGLWAERGDAALVLGIRTDRDDPRHRLVLSAVVRRLVGLVAGRPLRDANVPCKLVRRDLWREVRPLLPDDTFAPSIALAVAAARWGRPIRQVSVLHRARSSGASSLRPVRLARAVARAGLQTARLAAQLHRPR